MDSEIYLTFNNCEYYDGKREQIEQKKGQIRLELSVGDILTKTKTKYQFLKN